MALFNLKCDKCDFVERRMLAKFEPYTCKSCNQGQMERNPNFSVQVKERLDNGSMPRRVERLRDIETLNKQRSDNRKKQ